MENTGNPSISVVGNFTADRTRGDQQAGSSSFFPLSEAEFIFAANIDPFSRLDITVTAGDEGMGVEEGYITSKIGQSFLLKSGLKFLPLGRVNEVHPHALVYADRPQALVNLFGPEIFTGDGLLIERPCFVGDSVQTLTASVFSTANDVAFNPSADSEYAGLMRWTGVWDTTDFSTIELGATYVSGKNGIAISSTTDITAAHAAWKYTALQQQSLNIEAEWLQSKQGQGAAQASLDTSGGYLLADWGLNRNWRLFGRYDHTMAKAQSADAERAIVAGVVWKISEFQNITAQYKTSRNNFDQTAQVFGVQVGDNTNQWLLRWVVAIGPHGAHAY